MKSRKLDQRRYDFERRTGKKPEERELILLKKYTVSEVIAIINFLGSDKNGNKSS